MRIRLLPAAHRPAQAWRNGGGVTFEVARARHPRRPADFLWRVSIADVAQPGPFSAFGGYQRLIAVIEGPGMQLGGLEAQPVALRPFEVVRFDGGVQVEGLLPQGSVRDFNVIHDPILCGADLEFVGGGGEVAADAGTVLVVNVGGSACAWSRGSEHGALASLDAVQMEGEARRPLRWQGARIAVVRIEVK